MSLSALLERVEGADESRAYPCPDCGAQGYASRCTHFAGCPMRQALPALDRNTVNGGLTDEPL